MGLEEGPYLGSMILTCFLQTSNGFHQMKPSSPWEVEKGHEAVTESGVSQAILAEHTAIQCYPGVLIISVPGC